MQSSARQTLKLYARHSLKYPLRTILLFLLIVTASIVHNISPLYYKKFFDILSGAVPGSAVGKQLAMVLGMVAVVEGINWFLWRAGTVFDTYVQSAVLTDLNQTCFDALHRHSFSFFNNNFVGSLIKRAHRFINAFALLLDQLIWTLIPLVVNVFMITLVLWRRAPLLAWVILVWTALFILVNWFLARFKAKYDTAYGEIDSQVSGHFADTITNNASVKLFNSFRIESRTFSGLLAKAQSLQRIRWNLDSLFEAVQGLLVIALEIGILYVAIGFWQKGILTAGDFVLIQAYILSLINEIWGFGRTIRRMSEALADAAEMTEVLAQPFEIVDRPHAKPLQVQHGGVKFSDVSFAYQGKRQIFDKLNLTIKPGEKVAFVGPSGSGKSTLVKLLLRLYEVTGGSISIDDQAISEVTQESVWRAMSLVPQEPILFHRSIMENIRYGNSEASDEDVYAAAKAAHCHEFISRLPEGYATVAGERGLKLSGGERQRISIARAILRNAPILVLDEATSSLDSESERYIQDALTSIMPGKTVIIIAHRLSTIMQMDRIIVLKHGQLVEEGTHADLVARRGVYGELWKLQAGGELE